MELLDRLKAYFPIVFARETAGNDLAQVAVGSVATEAQDHEVTSDVKGLGADSSTESETKTLNLKEGPENYSDILVEKGISSEYFPERSGKRFKASVWKMMTMMEGREETWRLKCEAKLHDIVTSEPLIKLLIGALKTAGCDIDIRRNFSCEMCYAGVCGGYDSKTQQVVMCMNNISRKHVMTTVLAHELIHMFDHCVNDTDFTVAEHLACTEIRAINLTSCSLVDSFYSGYVSLTDLVTKSYNKKHSICVKDRALSSVMAASPSLSKEEAQKIIDKVFPYCYNDLEPIGRRLRHKTSDGDRAFYDGEHYGYV